jgi:hypothetical protein
MNQSYPISAFDAMPRVLDVAMRISANAGALMPSWLIDAAVNVLPSDPTREEIVSAFSRLAYAEIVRTNFQPTDPFLKGSMRMAVEHRAAARQIEPVRVRRPESGSRRRRSPRRRR